MRGILVIGKGLTVLTVAVLTFAGCTSSSEPENHQDSYVHIRAAWSPDGSTIAFTRVSNDSMGIYLVDTMGTNVRPLWLGDGIGVTWSPDGGWIAFSSNDSIHAISVTGDSIIHYTDGGGNVRPSWSPDGLRIAYVKKPNSIFLVNVANKVSIDLRRNLVDFPSWNPVTSELVYLAPDYYSNTQGIIYEFKALDIPADTARVIYSVLSNYEIGFSPISPTGDHIVYSVAVGGTYVQLYVADLLLRTSKRITDDGGDFGAWSPEGSRIVYTRTQLGDGGLWIMYADGSGRRRLTSP